MMVLLLWWKISININLGVTWCQNDSLDGDSGAKSLQPCLESKTSSGVEPLFSLVKSANTDFCPENMQMLIVLDRSLRFCLQPGGYTDHNRSWQKVQRPAPFSRQDPGDRHHVSVRNGLLSDWQIPHRDRALAELQWEGERERKGGKKRFFFSLSKGSIQWELHWREWDALSVCNEGWTEEGRGRQKKRERSECEKTIRRREGERKGGKFSACIFHSKTFWQGRAHSVAGRGGAILKSPTGSLRDAGSQNRYISGLPGFFSSHHTFLSCFLTASSESASRCLLIFHRNRGTVHTNTATLLINR